MKTAFRNLNNFSQNNVPIFGTPQGVKVIYTFTPGEKSASLRREYGV